MPTGQQIVSDALTMRSPRIDGTVFERLLFKIRVAQGPGPAGVPCWEYTNKTNEKGYGIIHVKGTARLAHRISFQIFNNRAPGPMLDHLCRNRRCVNPDHLEEVSALENFKRGMGADGLRLGPKVFSSRTNCPQGHPYDGENTYTKPNGHRICRACRREGMRANRTANCQ